MSKENSKEGGCCSKNNNLSEEKMEKFKKIVENSTNTSLNSTLQKGYNIEDYFFGRPIYNQFQMTNYIIWKFKK